MMVLKKLLVKGVPACLAAFAACSVNAMTFEYSGEIFYDVDVGRATFSLSDDVSNVTLKTESYVDGQNFDPILSLWQKSGSDYSLVSVNDDGDSSSYNSVIEVNALKAGDYLLTVSAYPNFPFAQLLSQGFSLPRSGATPQLLSTWCEPAAPTCDLEKGGHWDVVLETNGPSVPGVPEPSVLALFSVGLVPVAIRNRARRAAILRT